MASPSKRLCSAHLEFRRAQRAQSTRHCDHCKEDFFSARAFFNHKNRCQQGDTWQCTSSTDLFVNAYHSDDPHKIYVPEKVFDCNDFTDSSEDEEAGLLESDSDTCYIVPDTAHPPHNGQTQNVIADHENSTVKAIVMWICLFFVNCQRRFALSDTLLSQFLLFFKVLFNTLARICNNFVLQAVAHLFPATLFSMWKYLHVSRDNFHKYVACKKCYTLYEHTDCSMTVEGQTVSKLCCHKPYPHHTQGARSGNCNELLLKSLTFNGKTVLKPFKTFCYKPVKESLKRLLQRPGFEKKCELWRNRDEVHDTFMSDVYDGKIWKEFQTSEKEHFLQSRHRYGLMLNLDWFQPFKHVNYSVGVMYAVVLNLPREERFAIENVMIVGVLPTFVKEPPVATFIQPLVNELLEVWNNGVDITTCESPEEPVNVKFCLMCVGCDVPATRKLCGFLGHAATLGCNKCNKRFPGTFQKRDYSGFHIASWPKKSREQVHQDMHKVKSGKTMTECQQLASQLGVRYSPLIELPYFDVVRMSVIDPMHNLFLGTAKHMVQVWLEKGLLTEKLFQDLQAKIDMLEVPKSLGRLPRKIASSFGGFTAEQWKNWTVVFSLFALADILPQDYLKHWSLFVNSCRLLCLKNITKSQVEKAGCLLLDFCSQFETLYGCDKVTPNMHLHAHLASCLEDYGPVYSFWLFSFERYNGHLGNFPNNNQQVEVQFMNRFQRDSDVCSLPFPEELDEDFGAHVLSDQTCADSFFDSTQALKLSLLSDPLFDMKDAAWTDLQGYQLRHSVRDTISLHEQDLLKKMYIHLYRHLEVDPAAFMVTRSVWKAKSTQVADKLLGSCDSRHKRSSFVLAFWDDGHGRIIVRPEVESDSSKCIYTAGVIELFFSHHLRISGGKEMEHILVKVKWFEHMPSIPNSYLKPLVCCSPDLYCIEGPSTFMPIQRIYSTFVCAKMQIRGRKVMLASPAETLF